MSKERELLKIWASSFGNLHLDFDLLIATRELLAQPEHIVDVTDKVEPVAWVWKKHTAGGWLDVVSIDKPTANAHQINIRPLYYTAPSQREPLSDEEIDKGYQESDGNYYDLAFRDGVRFAEQQHGITGGGE